MRPVANMRNRLELTLGPSRLPEQEPQKYIAPWKDGYPAWTAADDERFDVVADAVVRLLRCIEASNTRRQKQRLRTRFALTVEVVLEQPQEQQALAQHFGVVGHCNTLDGSGSTVPFAGEAVERDDCVLLEHKLGSE